MSYFYEHPYTRNRQRRYTDQKSRSTQSREPSYAQQSCAQKHLKKQQYPPKPINQPQRLQLRLSKQKPLHPSPRQPSKTFERQKSQSGARQFHHPQE